MLSFNEAVELGNVPASVSCPSTGQCTAVDNSATSPVKAVQFNPTSPASPTSYTLSGTSLMTSVSCSSTSRCVAVDSNGNGFVGP